MKRTKNRALVTGSIMPISALTYAVALGLAGYVTLAVFTNPLATVLGAAGMFFYVVVYGYAKRKTVHGTLIGCISGAIPPVAGYAAASGRLDLAAAILFLILVFWQMAHFFSIALFRQKDYAATGMPIMPVVRGIERTKKQIIMYICLLIGAVLVLSLAGYTGYSFAIIMGCGCLYWLTKGLRTYSEPSAVAWGKGMFISSLMVIMMLAGMVSIGSVLP
jgi:protoheme IX farnesyltransferase